MNEGWPWLDAVGATPQWILRVFFQHRRFAAFLVHVNWFRPGSNGVQQTTADTKCFMSGWAATVNE